MKKRIRRSPYRSPYRRSPYRSKYIGGTDIVRKVPRGSYCDDHIQCTDNNNTCINEICEYKYTPKKKQIRECKLITLLVNSQAPIHSKEHMKFMRGVIMVGLEPRDKDEYLVELLNEKINRVMADVPINIFLIPQGGYRALSVFSDIFKKTIINGSSDVVGDFSESMSYDRYPLSRDIDAMTHNLVTFADNVVCKKLKENVGGNNIIVCGSRGGQVTLRRLWQLNIYNAFVDINGGSLGQPQWFNQLVYPIDMKGVCIIGGRDDVFMGELNLQQALMSDAKNKPGVFIVYNPIMRHMPNHDILHIMMPDIILLALTSDIQYGRNLLCSFPNLIIYRGNSSGQFTTIEM